MTQESQPDRVIIYTDGAAEPNPGPGGYGIVLIAGQHRKELSGGFRKTTNNRMELMAVIVGLESLKRPCRVTLYSDSKYVVDSVSHGSVFRWQKKNWFRTSRDRVKNVDLWKRFLEVFRKHQVEFRWVKGHAGIQENERCDELAVAATQGYDLPVDQGYLDELELTDALKTKGTLPDVAGETGEPTTSEHGQCRKCNGFLIKKDTKQKKPNPGQAYCYDWYLFCPGCGTMYMVDAAKRKL